MSQRVMFRYELYVKAFPYVIGIGVNFLTFKDFLIRVSVTCFSMLAGALFVHYLKPAIVNKIDSLKERKEGKTKRIRDFGKAKK